MSREEAVREAISDAFLDHGYDVWPDMYAEAQAALVAADAHDVAHGVHRIVLDDATVERAARTLFQSSNPEADWDRFLQASNVKEAYRKHARVMLAAAVQEER